MSPPDQFMAADVVLVVTFQFLFPFSLLKWPKNRTLALFYGVLAELYMSSWVFLGVTETDTFVLFCGYR